MKLFEVILVITFLYLLPLALTKEHDRRNGSINLIDLEPREIHIMNNSTDFVVEIDSAFNCATGCKCTITVEIRKMSCVIIYGSDPDPTYIKFTPLKAFGRSEAELRGTSKDVCENYAGENWNSLKYLQDHDPTSVYIQPVGNKWNIQTARVKLFVGIIQTRVSSYVLDKAVQDLELEISSSINYEIRMEMCNEEEDCPFTIFTQIKFMNCRGTNSILNMTTVFRNYTEIESALTCEQTFIPMRPLNFGPHVTSVFLSPLGNWETTGTTVVLISSVHLVHKSGESCPKGYFNCGNCSGGKKTPVEVTSCIPYKFLCDTKPHCSLPCNADESEAFCKRTVTNDPEIDHEIHEDAEKYSGDDLNNLYSFLVEMFIGTSVFTSVIVLSMGFFISYKVDVFGKRFGRTDQVHGHENFVHQEMSPTYHHFTKAR